MPLPDQLSTTNVRYGQLTEFLGNDRSSLPYKTVRTSLSDVADMLASFGIGLPNLVSITRFGAACDGVTDDSAAVNTAIVNAKSDGLWLWNPRKTNVSGNNLLGVHDVTWLGPGSFFRDSGGGVTDTFTVTPKADDVNNMYAASTGGIDNDGLSASLPRLIVQDLINAVSNRLFGQWGNWNINLASGVFTNQRLQIQNLINQGGDLVLKGGSVGLGTNPLTGATEFMTNTQPLAIFDGVGASTTINTIASTSLFNVGFTIFPNDNRTLSVFVDGVTISEVQDTDTDVSQGYTLILGALVAGVYSSAQILFTTPIASGHTVMFTMGFGNGLAVADNVKTARIEHVEFKNYSQSQIQLSDSTLYTTNIWRTGGQVGQTNLNHARWFNVGGVAQQYSLFGIHELFGTIRSLRQCRVLNADNTVNLALSRARGLWIRNSAGALAYHAKEGCIGHGDFTTYTDTGVPIYFSRGCGMGVGGVKVIRPSDVPWAMVQGSWIGGGYLQGEQQFDLSFGTADAPKKAPLYDRASGLIHQENRNYLDVDKSRGLGGMVPEISGSFPRLDNTATFSQAPINDTSGTGLRVTDYGSFPYGAMVRIGAYDEYEFEAEKAGTANIGQFQYQIAAVTYLTFTLPATATWCRAYWRLTVLDSDIYGGGHTNSQQIIAYLTYDLAGVVQPIQRQKIALTLPLSDTTQRFKRLTARVANNTDSVTLLVSVGKTTGQRTVENAE
jgi:hypothetical protein